MSYRFQGSAVLLDIEGTTSSVSFVYDVMFPFVRRELASHLAANWGQPDLMNACEQIARDAGQSTFAAWTGAVDSTQQQQRVVSEVERLMDGDVKATGLKQLQGQIWKAGFESGEMQAHVFEDVPPALQRWTAAGVDVRIYSSGSVQAQKLFFGHTIYGNLLPHFRGHYDTTVGGKKVSESYTRIASEFDCQAEQILFVSDVLEELQAARSAGLQALLASRPGNAEVSAGHGHPSVQSFSEIHLD